MIVLGLGIMKGRGAPMMIWRKSFGQGFICRNVDDPAKVLLAVCI